MLPWSNVAAPTLCFTLIRVCELSSLRLYFSHLTSNCIALFLAYPSDPPAQVGLRTVPHREYTPLDRGHGKLLTAARSPLLCHLFFLWHSAW